MSSMKHVDTEGGSVITIVAIVLLAVMLVGAGAFGVWSYMGRQDYKNNSDQKVAVAVQSNTKKVQAADAAIYAEEAKKPLKTYVGPAEFGSLHLTYPRTWSGYVVLGNSGNALDGYFAPDVVPYIQAQASTFALRVQITSTSYSDILQQFSSQQKQGKVTVTPYTLAKVSGVVGSRIDGQISSNKQGSMIVLPMRDKTLKLWTESDTYMNDFNTNILPNTSFSP